MFVKRDIMNKQTIIAVSLACAHVVFNLNAMVYSDSKLRQQQEEFKKKVNNNIRLNLERAQISHIIPGVFDVSVYLYL